ncbi:phenylalanine--tRNA ligase subunit beta [Marinibactrum halimedae]|uniref:Phenylalanine--tRNA ligase beta subunit n=1 Tax=Marinibactrum halimedae TaxID=1444977 RepID=A0AA37WPZ8_9GAMM|nr:phenylalanine--tRNA ligase subunit beta [Marinibactrum halimedae]MCD9459432.1 phenylalanine--tRNA ligase subunit beta [Marinibactrum halimedae]GLS27501.1 phenylalanine--tRNA ligase beta subunit [Marinibactrum halimedae]
MKFSEAWLREWVSPELTTESLAEQITMAGLEVDAIEKLGGLFSGVVVGEIVSADQHPDADKLRVCSVKGDGDELKQVVCGAPNARPGIKIPFATVGAQLPPGEDGKPFKIKKAKLRGVESFGMLCAQTELQLGDDDDGLWELPDEAPTGAPLESYLNLNDALIEVDLTPNRSDCLSVKGIAREVAVLNRLPFKGADIPAVKPVHEETFSVTLNAPEGCAHYVGRIIKNVDVSKPSPLWMQEKLRRSGIRSIDAVVDVTNYVLLELGQPMHAFDFSTLEGGIDVRLATAEEPLTLLDGQEVKLNEETLVIADAKKAVAMAGIMGGAETAVSDQTQDIFLESAFFNPLAIAGRARRYGLHTDSSHRFERGVDYRLQSFAIERATQLLLDIVGGEPGPLVEATSQEYLPKEGRVELRRERIESGLGFSLPDDEVLDILTRLGLELLDSSDVGWTFTIPSYRFDISIEEDLLEELARVYGYNNLPTTSLEVPLAIPESSERQIGLSPARRLLAARGYQEAICYSFVDPKILSLIEPDAVPVVLQNPISADMSVMRTTLWAGLLPALTRNINRQQSRVRLFETGLRFCSPDGSLEKLVQEPMIAGLIYGPRQPETWHGKSDNVDFYDLKADVEALLGLSKTNAQFVSGEHSALHPGQTAKIIIDGVEVGILGAIHPQLQKAMDIPNGVFLFELSQKVVTEAALPDFAPLSKQPEMRRDIAVVVDQSVSANELLQEVRDSAGQYLTQLKIFDVYVGKGIDKQRKSVALGLTFQHPSSTLKDEQVNGYVGAVVEHLHEKLNATLR